LKICRKWQWPRRNNPKHRIFFSFSLVGNWKRHRARRTGLHQSSRSRRHHMEALYRHRPRFRRGRDRRDRERAEQEQTNPTREPDPRKKKTLCGERRELTCDERSGRSAARAAGEGSEKSRELLGGAGEKGARGRRCGRANMQDWEGCFGKVGAWVEWRERESTAVGCRQPAR
jgi:hypothetical protein